MKILIDAMGGDNAPLCVLQGAAQAAAEFGQGMDLVLLGDEAALKACAAQNHIDLAPFTIVPCSEVVDMHDDPVKAARHKPDSSLVKGLTMLKNGEGDAFVSAGSTGALHVGTSLIVRTLKGVKRRRWPPRCPAPNRISCCWTAAPTPSAGPRCSTPSAPWAASMPKRSWAARSPKSPSSTTGRGYQRHPHLPRSAPAAQSQPLHPVCRQHRAALHHGRRTSTSSSATALWATSCSN